MLIKQYAICIVFKCVQEEEIFIRHIFCKITFLNCYISHKKILLQHVFPKEKLFRRNSFCILKAISQVLVLITAVELVIKEQEKGNEENSLSTLPITTIIVRVIIHYLYISGSSNVTDHHEDNNDRVSKQ